MNQILSVTRGKLCLLSLGAAGVIIGIWMKQGLANQAGMTKMKNAGSLAFLAGWAIVAYALACDNKMNLMNGLKTPRGIIGIVAPAIIVISVYSIMAAKDKGLKPPMLAGAGFVLGWIAIGLSVGLPHAGRQLKLQGLVKSKGTWIGLLGAVLILASMLRVLPWERSKKITDSLGMAMFAAGWGNVAFANALV